MLAFQSFASIGSFLDHPIQSNLAPIRPLNFVVGSLIAHDSLEASIDVVALQTWRLLSWASRRWGERAPRVLDFYPGLLVQWRDEPERFVKERDARLRDTICRHIGEALTRQIRQLEFLEVKLGLAFFFYFLQLSMGPG